MVYVKQITWLTTLFHGLDFERTRLTMFIHDLCQRTWLTMLFHDAPCHPLYAASTVFVIEFKLFITATMVDHG